jgi:transcriptional regulator with XRE-family HTH domain
MKIINQNVRFLREREKWTQKEFATKLDISVSQLGAYEEFRATPPLPIVVKIADLFKIDLDTLIRIDMGKGSAKKLKKNRLMRGKEVLAITVDQGDRENVELVNQKAFAGYLSGYYDVEFVKELPKVNLPMLPRNATYRCFEIKGESMLPVMPGSFVIGSFIDDLDKIKDGVTYIVVTNDGIVYKRVFKFMKDEKLLLVSDNAEYKPYLVNMSEVLQIWAFAGYFTFNAPVVELPKKISLDHLALRVVESMK